METRGLMMLLVGSALMLSPVAIWLTSEPKVAATETAAAPAEGTAAADPLTATAAPEPAEPTCTAAAIVSTATRVNCDGQTVKDTSRRVTSGGAVFVTVGN